MPPDPDPRPPPTPLPSSENLGSLLEGFRPRLERMVALRLDQRLCRRIEVGDVLQEGFVEVTRRLEEYRSAPSMSFYLWVRLVTGQKLLEIHRRHLGTERRGRTREISTPFPAASSVSMAEALLDPASSPSEMAAHEEEQRHLQAALEKLDETDREVLVLRYFELLTNEEAAQVLGLTPSGAKKRHSRALTHLKHTLGHLESLWRPPGEA